MSGRIFSFLFLFLLFFPVFSNALETLDPATEAINQALKHLTNTHDLQFLGLGPSFKVVTEQDKIPFCSVTVVPNNFTNSTVNKLHFDDRTGKNACTDKNADNIYKAVEPGQCSLIIAKTESKTQVIVLRVESQELLEGIRSDYGNWAIVHLCNRLETPQYFNLTASLYIQDKVLDTSAKTLIGRVDFSLPKDYPTTNPSIFPSKETGSLRTRGQNVTVRRFVGVREIDTQYTRTDRGLIDLQNELYPPEMLDVASLQRTRAKVLDAGCGDGAFVMDLRAAGIDAIGLDINLNDEQKKIGFYVQGDMSAMGFKDQEFDVIYSTYTVFTAMYEGKNLKLIEKVLLEFKRVLKPGGVIRIGGGDHTNIEAVLTNIPGLKVTQKSSAPDQYIEIKKL